MSTSRFVPTEFIEQRIFLIRGQKVMLDFHLAELYGVKTKALIQAIKRNPKRFPPEFMFQLTKDEYNALRSQFVTSNMGRGGRRYLPYAFTEHGVAMLSSVLKSERAIAINIVIIKTFVKLRVVVAAHKEIAEKLLALERKVSKHDNDIGILFEAIRRLFQPPEKPKRQIGFRVDEPKVPYRLKR